ncbi:T9SS type A sorting domain-containing protein [Formosa maritima]|uniref:T9SS type A sorting domain-containing protein n=1 Tax=Formosa maritima TaxID=2592046 RepID=A0A5D0GD18_9FLAO|nr:T9SS type A sorting domain-containing protein [Formosa maritima]TYA55727.1 T9SS type A sorting domain-containing protein [Formosa maritima]
MKKSFFLVLLWICSSHQSSFSQQLEVIGSNDFGRVFDLTYDKDVENKVYAVTLGNHIVVSYDNGLTWDVLYSLEIHQSASVTDLKISPDGTTLTFNCYVPNTMYSSIKVYDINTATIIKTIDVPNQSDHAYIDAYDFYESDMDILLLSTRYQDNNTSKGKTFYTTDGGENWDMVYFNEDHDYVFIADVAIYPSNPDKLFLTRGNGPTNIDGGLFVSEDAGQNWIEKLPGVNLDPIKFNPDNNLIMWIGSGIGTSVATENLYKSIDGGDNFTTVPINWTDSALDNIRVIQINENNPLQMIVLEENEIVISEDGGVTWENYVYPSGDPESYFYGLNASYNPFNSEELFISSNFVPQFSSDGGETLTWVKTPYFASSGNLDAFSNESYENVYYGVQYGYVWRDLATGIDSPRSIMPLDNFTVYTPMTVYADKITANRIYTFTEDGSGSTLKVSNENGLINRNLVTVAQNKVTAIATYPNMPQTIITAFAAFSASSSILKKINFNNLNNVIITDITLPTINYIRGIIIDESGKITISDGIEVYSSNNDGVTWTNSSTGLEVLTPSDLILDLQVDPLNPNHMALASSKGIFMSVDGGENWDRKTTLLTHKVAFSTETEGVLVATTHDSYFSRTAIHYSTNSGESWTTISNDQLLSITSSHSAYIFNSNSVKIYIGSSDLGLVEYDIDFSLLNTPQIENVDEMGLIIYPNPTKNLLNVKINNSNVGQLTIYSLTGTKILDIKNSSKIDISSLPSGTYLVRIQDLNNTIYFKRIIKQ